VFSTTVFVLRGETYLGGKLPIGRQGKGGVAIDFLTADESTKSFSVVDIKTPATPRRGFEQLNRLHPKGVLITGSLSGLSQRQRESFNQFRYGLFSLTVITYDEVLSRLRALFRSEPASLEDDEIRYRTGCDLWVLVRSWVRDVSDEECLEHVIDAP